MPRDLEVDGQAAVESRFVSMLVFARFDFASGTVRVHNGGAIVPLGGHDWLPLGSHGTLEAMEETLEVQGRSIQFSLSGLDSDLKDAVTSTSEADYYGRECEVYVAFFNTETCAPLTGLISLGWAYMDEMDAEISRGQARIELRADSEQARWDKVPGWRLNHEHQQLLYPGDMGFEYQHTEGDAVWGSYRVVAARFRGTFEGNRPVDGNIDYRDEQ